MAPERRGPPPGHTRTPALQAPVQRLLAPALWAGLPGLGARSRGAGRTAQSRPSPRSCPTTALAAPAARAQPGRGHGSEVGLQPAVPERARRPARPPLSPRGRRAQGPDRGRLSPCDFGASRRGVPADIVGPAALTSAGPGPHRATLGPGADADESLRSEDQGGAKSRARRVRPQGPRVSPRPQRPRRPRAFPMPLASPIPPRTWCRSAWGPAKP